MAQEIERKFLLSGEGWRRLAQGIEYRQGYLCASKERAVRVRLAGNQGYLTVKGATVGAARSEYEYEIPPDDARSMLNELCMPPLIEKKRYTIPFRGFIWEIDEFFGLNAGLIVAEIELEAEDQAFERPEWIGEEVTGDPRYYNAALCTAPFSTWETSGEKE